MLEDKKGQVSASIVGVVITAVLAVVLVANLAIPVVKDSLNLETNEKVLTASGNNTVELEYGNIETITIDGLTEDTNYVVDYEDGLVNFTDASDGDYNSTYDYKPANYIEKDSHRALWSVASLAFIIGVLLLILRGFGIM